MSKKHLNKKLREIEKQKEFEILIESEKIKQDLEKNINKKEIGNKLPHYILEIQDGNTKSTSSF
jgi:vacuolar-type H+-ATPase subunit F/Vma7